MDIKAMTQIVENHQNLSGKQSPFKITLYKALIERGWIDKDTDINSMTVDELRSIYIENDQQKA